MTHTFPPYLVLISALADGTAGIVFPYHLMPGPGIELTGAEMHLLGGL